VNEYETMLIERECSRLVIRFCLLVDAYRHEELVKLWTPDAVWETWRGPVRGMEEIRAYLEAKDRSDTGIHVVQNILVDVKDARNAQGSAVFTYYANQRGDADAARTPRVIGRYEDRFALTNEGWRIASRSTEMVFAGA
jgi:hypothetical protein